jgi:acetyltransferase-like isoleucine patch superfamily enzyme
MRHDIVLAQIDVNDEELRLYQYQYKNRDHIEKDSVLLTCESSKAVTEITSAYTGYIYFLFEEDAVVEVNSVIAIVFDSIKEYDEFLDSRKKADSSHGEDASSGSMATAKAKKLAFEKNVDLADIKKEGIIKEDDVVSFLEAQRNNSGESKMKQKVNISKSNRRYKYDNERIAIIGAGKGAQVLVDILLDYDDKTVVFLVDDVKKDFSVYGNKYEVSPFSIFEFAEKSDRDSFDTAIISMSANLKAMRLRKKIYDYYVNQDIVFTNVIAKSADIRRDVMIGNGNIIGAHAYIGTKTVIGNDNFISYNTFIGHHNIIGNTNLIAPGVITSGSVSIGSDCIIPAGVVCINRIKIGNNVIFPLGYNVSGNVESNVHIKDMASNQDQRKFENL